MIFIIFIWHKPVMSKYFFSKPHIFPNSLVISLTWLENPQNPWEIHHPYENLNKNRDFRLPRQVGWNRSVNPRLSHDYPMLIPMKPYVKLYFKVIKSEFSNIFFLIPRILPMIHPHSVMKSSWPFPSIPWAFSAVTRKLFSRRSWQRIWRRKRSAWKRRGWWSSSWERHHFPRIFPGLFWSFFFHIFPR